MGGKTEGRSKGLTLFEDMPKAEVGTLHTLVLCHFTDEETEAENHVSRAPGKSRS